MLGVRSGVQFGLLSVLLAPAAAIPALPLKELAGLISRQADNLQDATSVCQRSLTADLWKDGGYSKMMSTWLINGPANGGYAESGPDKSPLDVILSYATKVDGYACTPLDATNAHCTSQDIGSSENCEFNSEKAETFNDPAAVTMLKAIANFANFMVSASAEARNLGDDIAKKQDELQSKFGLDPAPRDSNGQLGINQGPLIMAGAMAGTIPVMGGILAAPLGFLVGLNNPLQNTAWEPKFDQYMQFEAFMSNVSIGIETGFKQAAEIAINHAPAVGFADIKKWAREDKSSLPQVLNQGNFADSSTQTLGAGKDAMSKVLYSAGINSIWNFTEIIVVRTTKNSYPGLADNLCGPQDAKNNPFDAGIKYCDEDGAMYVLQRYDGLTQDVPGFDKLADYGLDLATVMKNSWAWQQKRGINPNITSEDAAAVFDYDDPSKLDPNAMQLWTLPVCDLDTAKVEKEINADTTYMDCTKADDEALCWFQLNFMCRCSAMKGWPLDRVPPNLGAKTSTCVYVNPPPSAFG